MSGCENLRFITGWSEVRLTTWNWQFISECSQCGGLNNSGPHRSTRSGTFKMCDLVVVGMALLQEVCHWGWALRFNKLKPSLVAQGLFLLPADVGVELSGDSPAPSLPACHPASCYDVNGPCLVYPSDAADD